MLARRCPEAHTSGNTEPSLQGAALSESLAGKAPFAGSGRNPWQERQSCQGAISARPKRHSGVPADGVALLLYSQFRRRSTPRPRKRLKARALQESFNVFFKADCRGTHPMSPITPDPAQLQALIGRQVRYGDRLLVVIDVLLEGPALVLEDPMAQGRIQANQFGDAARRGPATLTLPVLDPASGELHPVMHELQVIAGEND